jgi:hypothetical protein
MRQHGQELLQVIVRPKARAFILQRGQQALQLMMAARRTLPAVEIAQEDKFVDLQLLPGDLQPVREAQLILQHAQPGKRFGQGLHLCTFQRDLHARASCLCSSRSLAASAKACHTAARSRRMVAR